MRSVNWLPAVLSEDWTHGGFGLYIHWPFCEAKCPYCDFNSHVSSKINQLDWRQAYLKEIDRVAATTPGRVLNSVYFGGGTPSLMEPKTVAAILDRVQNRWRLANDVEITLEANPSSVEIDRFQSFREGGVNRVSLGIQSLTQDDLRRLGRIHSVSDAYRALEIAQSTFDRVSFDLIYGRQNQTLAAWEAELSKALDMATDHLSLYQLTIEPGTAFGDRYKAGKLRGLPSDDLGADMYDLTQEMCASAGLPAYEVSNHAASGAESRHNLVYWRYGDYAGIGPGAHGRLTIGGQRYASETPLNPNVWLERAMKGAPESVFATIEPQDQVGEYLMMGLRVNDGVDLVRLRNFGYDADQNTAIFEMVELGLLKMGASRLWATQKGRLVLNSVVAQILPD